MSQKLLFTELPPIAKNSGKGRIVVALIMLLQAALAIAGTNQWTSVGPLAANLVYGFAVDPSSADTLYIAAFGYPGLWQSTDRGNSWTLLGAGTPLATDRVLQVAIDADKPQHLVAAGAFNVFRSFDGGASWLGSDLPSSTRALAASRNLLTIYLGAEQNCIGLFGSGCSGGGVLTSTDGGATWSKSALTNRTVGSVTIDWSDSRIAYAISWDDAPGSYVDPVGGATLMRTLDSGQSWTRIGPAVDRVSGPSGSRLLVGAGSPSTLYLNTKAGLWTSGDRGDTWRILHSEHPFDEISAFASDPTDPTAIFAATPGWPEPSPCPTPPPPIGCPPSPPTPSPDQLFGVIRSSDGGAMWRRVVDPALPKPSAIDSGEVFALVVNQRRTTFYEIRSDGVFEYTLALPRSRAARH